MEIRIGKDINAYQPDQDENHLPLFKGYFEEQKREQSGEERKGVVKDDRIG